MLRKIFLLYSVVFIIDLWYIFMGKNENKFIKLCFWVCEMVKCEILKKELKDFLIFYI